MSQTKDQNEAACGGSALTAELGNELPGKNARTMLPLLKEIAERDAEIERLSALARDAYDAWDNDRDAKVGKLLRAIIDDEFRKTYRQDTVPNADVTGLAPREDTK